MKKHNVAKFTPLHRGDRVIVTKEAHMAQIQWARGTVIAVQDNKRSPYKNLVTVWLEGSAKYGNPWHVFRNEVEKINDENHK